MINTRSLIMLRNLIELIDTSSNGLNYREETNSLIDMSIKVLNDIKNEVNIENKENKIPEPYLYPSVKDEHGNVYCGEKK